MKKAEVLIDALSFIRQFKGAVFVVKLGGEVLVDEEVVSTVSEDLAFLEFVGIKSVVVHGGGKRISEAMEGEGKKPLFVGGLRVTDEDTIRIAGKVLADVNSEISGKIGKLGGKASSIPVGDKCVFDVVKRKGGVDYGFVGDIVKVNSKLLTDQFEKGCIPIVSPLGLGADGMAYNINADTASAAIAKALKAEKIIIMTTVSGVLGKDGKLIHTLTVSEAEKFVKSSAVSGGMIPKLNACIEALKKSVSSAHIIKASRHALLEEILTREGTGTMITN